MDPSRKRLLLIVAIVIGVVIIFLAGYLPGSLRAQRVSEESRRAAQQLEAVKTELAKTRFDLDVARLRGSLGEVLHEANAKNFGVAAERATTFFDGLRAAVNSSQLPPATERRNVLETILGRRDEISADLARADQGVKAKLAEMYMQFARAVE